MLTRLLSSSKRPTRRRLPLFAALLVVLLTSLTAAAADPVITLKPGQEARIPIRLWCMNYGKPFPAALIGPTQTGSENVTRVLQAAVNQGVLDSDPFQVQLAVWQAIDGVYHSAASFDRSLAEKLTADAAGLALTPAPAGVLPLDEAVTQKLVSVAVEGLTPLTNPIDPTLAPFTGAATMVIKNTGAATVRLSIVGIVFNPSGGADAQNLAAVQDPTIPATLPLSGAGLASNTAAWIALGVLLLAGGAWLRRRGHAQQPAHRILR